MSLLNDKPIGQPKDDKFGFSPFAEAIAQAIVKNKNPEGTVIAVHGPWGSGKSSVINLVKYHLERKMESEQSQGALESSPKSHGEPQSIVPQETSSPSGQNEKKPVQVSLKILDFKCWWFKGEEALTLEFFRQLYSALDESGLKEAKEAVAQLGSRMLGSSAPLMGAVANSIVPGAGGAAASGVNFLRDLIKQEKTIEELHSEISKALKNSKKRYLVIIDDIDRLSPDEALLIFRLVKSVGQLPKITYLLAYDREVAEKIVLERYPSEGPHYLEKIVQAGFDIPYPLRPDLQNFFWDFLRELWKDVMESEDWKRLQESDGQRLQNLFDNVVAPQLQSPRDAIRIINALDVTWPAVAGEVDPVDFLALETLRIKEPRFHAILKANREWLIDCDQKNGFDEDPARKASRYDRIFLGEFQDEKREKMKIALCHLFPQFDSLWKKSTLAIGYGITLPNNPELNNYWRRACSPNHFDTYFRFSLTQGVVSMTEINDIIQNSGDADYVKKSLLEINATHLERLLDELRLHAKEIPVDNAEAFLHGLFAACDQVAMKMYDLPDFGLTDDDSDTNLLCFLWQILKNFLSGCRDMVLEKRSEIISRAVKDCKSLALTTYLAMEEYRDHHPQEGKPPQHQALWLMTESDMEDFSQVVLEKIEVAAENNSLLRSRKFMIILFTWNLLAKSKQCEGKARSWCMKKLHDDFAVARFAEVFVLQKPIFNYISPSLKDLLESEKLKQRVEEVLGKTDPQSKCYEILELFLKSYKDL